MSVNINLWLLSFIKLYIFPSQIFHEKALVANAGKNVLRNGYFLAFVDVNQDGSFDINHSIKQKFIKELTEIGFVENFSKSRIFDMCCKPVENSSFDIVYDKLLKTK